MENPIQDRVRTEVVLLDAYGTLLDLPDPVPRLRALLDAAGHPYGRARVAAALRGEIAFYRAHHDRGRDPDSLAALRHECARVLADGLGAGAPSPARLAPLLVDSLRFRLFHDVVPALDALAAAGLRLGVVSNWDCSLPGVLEDLGIAGRFDVVAASATAGAAKPDPAIFHVALEAVGAAPGAALHCGDLPNADCAGARAAGIRAVLIDRRGAHPEGRCPRIASLAELARWTGS